jgi:uncharacterized membrane protein YeaQ/YmgE (transglycosylase-associated protein family)
MLYAIILGGIAGWLTGLIMRGEGYGIIVNILLGIAGGIIGSLVFGLLGFTTSSIVGELITAIVGASLLVFLVRKLSR